MNFKEIARLIDDFVRVAGKGTVNIFGGESMVRPDIFEIIGKAKAMGLSVGITTCCRVPEKLIYRLLDSGIDRFTTNLDGATPRTHDWLRNTDGNFEEAVKTLRMFIEKGTYTTVNSVLHEGNLDEVIPILELCGKLEVDAQAFYFFTPTGRGRGMTANMIGPVRWLETKTKVMEWIQNNSPKFSISWEQAYEPVCLTESVTAWRCEKDHSETLFVRCDGEVYSCALLDGAPCSLGNVRKESLKTILENRSRYAFKRERGCPALAFHVKKNLNSGDPRASTNLIGLGCPYEYRILNNHRLKGSEISI